MHSSLDDSFKLPGIVQDRLESPNFPGFSPDIKHIKTLKNDALENMLPFSSSFDPLDMPLPGTPDDYPMHLMSLCAPGLLNEGLGRTKKGKKRKRAKKERVVMTPNKEKNLKLMSDTYERNKIGQIGALKRGRIDFPLQGMSIIAPRTTVASLSVPVPMFKCIYPACNKYFIETSRLYYHVREHQQSLNCPYCSKSNKCMATLIYHVRTHTREKPYICHVAGCDFSSSTKCNLVAHLKSDIHHAPLKGADVYPWFKDYLELDIKPYLRNKHRVKKIPRQRRKRRRMGLEPDELVPDYLNPEDHSLKMVPLSTGLGNQKGPMHGIIPMANPPTLPPTATIPHCPITPDQPRTQPLQKVEMDTMKPEDAEKLFQMFSLPPSISTIPQGHLPQKWDPAKGFPNIPRMEPSPGTLAQMAAGAAITNLIAPPLSGSVVKMPPTTILINR